MTKDKHKQRSLSRRSFIQRTAAAAGGIWLMPGARAAKPAASPSNRPAHPDPDLILVNGKIHTMDSKNTIASAVVIKDGRFIEVGHAARVQRGPETTVIDLRGRTVVPGIIDNHNHLVLMGNRPGHHTPLENAYSIADVQAIYAARAASIPVTDEAGVRQWITTIGGFHFNQIADPVDPNIRRLPTRAELDAAVPNHPVFASISFNGPATTNSAGKGLLEGVGVIVAENGAIGTASATGSPRALLYLRQPSPLGAGILTPATRRRGVLDAMAYAASVGVTTHIDQGAFQKTDTTGDGAAHEDNFTMHIPFLEIYEQGKGKVRLRINFLHMESDPETPQLRERLKNAFPFLGDDMVKTGGIGEFIAAGVSFAAGSPFLEAARRVAKARWRAEVHSLSRTDFQQEITAFEIANAEFPITDLRWVVAHVPFITEDYVNRLKAIGGGLSLTSWRYLAGTAVNNGPPFRMIVNNGINTGMSSDGMQIAPMNPWIHMYYAVTGKNARGELINDTQQITRQEVLSLYTRQNKWFVREDDLGSIEPGNRADLLALNADYFAVPDEQIKRIRPVLTVVAGNIEHNEGVLDVRKG
jgi:predicted amidohydrolase YtcJ